jgi:anti-sigma factor RsiW
MHDVIINELENHLSGVGNRGISRSFYAHLDQCAACRADVAEIENVSALLHEMRSEPGTTPEPRPGFYNRVAVSIIDRQQKEAWGLFSPGPLFFRRIAFASLLLLAGLGSFLVSRESSFIDSVSGGGSGTDAAAIMAQHDPTVAHAEGSDRDRMLVTLATYRRE